MKRCPECGSSFPDTDQFCELDGTLLAEDYSASNPVVSDRIELLVKELRGCNDKLEANFDVVVQKAWERLKAEERCGVTRPLSLGQSVR